MDAQRELERIAFALGARKAVRLLCGIAASVGARVVAIKGLHASLIGGDSVRRVMGDVDLVVCGPGAHDRVLDALRERDDWTVCPDEDHSTPVYGPYSVMLDLHRSPLPRHLGRLSTARLLQHARPAPAPFDSLLIPDAVDGAIVALAHFTKDRVGRFGSRNLRLDLALFEADGANPREVAERVNLYGLRRVVLIALAKLERDDGAFGRYIEALAPSRAELTIARAISAGFDSLALRAPRATWWAVRALPDAPKQVALGVLWQLRVSLTQRLSRWMGPRLRAELVHGSRSRG